MISCAIRTSGHHVSYTTETQDNLSKIRRCCTPVRRSRVPDLAVPCSATQHPHLARCRSLRVGDGIRRIILVGVPIIAPFPNVSQHVVKPPLIRRPGSGGMGATLRVLAIPGDPI